MNGTLRKIAMRKHGTAALLLLFFAATIALEGCASRRLDLTQSEDQLAFGVRMARTNLWREALFRFERAVELDPSNPMALNNLAVAYEGIGEFEKARDAYARALRLDRSNEYIQKNYSRFVEFSSRNRKREQVADDETEAAAETAEAEEAPSEPVQVSQPEEPPKPGEIPVSDLPPDPAPPVPQTPPETPPPGDNR